MPFRGNFHSRNPLAPTARTQRSICGLPVANVAALTLNKKVSYCSNLRGAAATMTTAVQQRSLESLPLTWLSQLATFLPAHQKLKLRQCSRQMQQVVDATGVRLRLDTPMPLSLVSQLLTTLDVTDLATSPELQRTSQTLSWAEAGSLPRVTHLICGSNQHQLLSAVAQCSPMLARLTLRFKGAFTEQDQLAWELLPSKAPGLITSLRCLGMDHRCHAQFLGQECMQQVVGVCTNLQSLVMRMPQDAGVFYQFGAEVWQGAIQPLSSLTRLEMGMLVLEKDQSSTLQQWSNTAPDALLQAGQLEQDPQADLQTCLPHLQHLKCFGLDTTYQLSWNLTWVGQHTNLTCLELMHVSSGEVDFEVIAQLQQLCSLTLHCSPDELFSSSQLAPLSSCNLLTCLRLDALVIEPGHTAVYGTPTAAKLDTAGGTGTETTTSNVHPLAQHSSTDASIFRASAGQTASASSAAGLAPGVVLPQLRSLQKLVAGLLCQAPVSTFAPNLTQLRDLDYNLDLLELSSSFLNEHPPAGQEPLAGLDSLQLLAVNILALVRHTASPTLTQLSSLKELQLDMVGNLHGTCIGAPGGLPRLPQLTKLVMKLGTQDPRLKPLATTYTTDEDVLLWQNQHSVRHLRVRGSKLLGGFLVHGHLLALLPEKMPDLQLIELVKCVDLTADDLMKLVHSRAARRVLVQGCAHISERCCMELQQGVGGDVIIDYST